MNFIQEIQITENNAKEKITNAKKTASEIIKTEQIKQSKEIEEFKIEIKKAGEIKKDKQKIELAELYKTITAKGEKESESIKETSKRNKNRAISFVLENLLSTS